MTSSFSFLILIYLKLYYVAGNGIYADVKKSPKETSLRNAKEQFLNN